MMKISKRIGAAVAFACILGCESQGPKYEVEPAVQLSAPLTRSRGVVIETPGDGSIRDKVYEGSGRETAAAFQKAFAAFASNVSVIDCRTAACAKGNGYVVALQILNWEDRATGWSGNRDRVAVRVNVLDGATGRTITSNILLAAGTVSARLSGDLLPELVKGYVKSLY